MHKNHVDTGQENNFMFTLNVENWENMISVTDGMTVYTEWYKTLKTYNNFNNHFTIIVSRMQKAFNPEVDGLQQQKPIFSQVQDSLMTGKRSCDEHALFYTSHYCHINKQGFL